MKIAIRIAIQGEAGSFSHEAARRLVPGCQIIPCARSAEVFDRLERGLVAAAVIPIENSLAGSVTEHFDLLLARQVFIQREHRLRIVHNLIAPPGVKRGDLRRAYSHPVALEQCRDFFARNPKIQPMPFYDTAGSVKHVAGALFKALAVFALRDISLTKIESRPRRGRPWEYVFYADFLRGDDEPARNALHHLSEVADLVKVLGIYPAA